ncbi:MAG: hypothetical protein EBR87_04505 [Cytophagia bacterium]|nr:hypothetical protein [Cytophagia bacterium]
MMNSPNVVFGSALAIIMLGYLLKSFGFIKTSDGKAISNFLMHTTFPALVFTTMIKVDLRAELIWMPIICAVFGSISSILGFLIFKKEDPKELLVAINEFAYSISVDSKNMISACYWVEWIIEFDAVCKQRKQPCSCEKRNYYAVETKYQKDIIWLLWDVILENGKQKGTFIEKILTALLNLFCIKYTTASSKKRRYILYYAVELFTEPVSQNIEIVGDKARIEHITNNIDEVYKQIKKNEDSPKTDYLFKNIEKQKTLERSLKQMEIMSSIDSGQGTYSGNLRFPEPLPSGR